MLLRGFPLHHYFVGIYNKVPEPASEVIYIPVPEDITMLSGGFQVFGYIAGYAAVAVVHRFKERNWQALDRGWQAEQVSVAEKLLQGRPGDKSREDYPRVFSCQLFQMGLVPLRVGRIPRYHQLHIRLQCPERPDQVMRALLFDQTRGKKDELSRHKPLFDNPVRGSVLRGADAVRDVDDLPAKSVFIILFLHL